MPISDPTIRFSDRVDNYLRYRTGYPPAVLEVLKYECGLKPSSVVADVASGLGTPIIYSLTRESVVAGAVQVVGG